MIINNGVMTQDLGVVVDSGITLSETLFSKYKQLPENVQNTVKKIVSNPTFTTTSFFGGIGVMMVSPFNIGPVLLSGILLDVVVMTSSYTISDKVHLKELQAKLKRFLDGDITAINEGEIEKFISDVSERVVVKMKSGLIGNDKEIQKNNRMIQQLITEQNESFAIEKAGRLMDENKELQLQQEEKTLVFAFVNISLLTLKLTALKQEVLTLNLTEAQKTTAVQTLKVNQSDIIYSLLYDIETGADYQDVVVKTEQVKTYLDGLQVAFQQMQPVQYDSPSEEKFHNFMNKLPFNFSLNYGVKPNDNFEGLSDAKKIVILDNMGELEELKTGLSFKRDLNKLLKLNNEDILTPEAQSNLLSFLNSLEKTLVDNQPTNKLIKGFVKMWNDGESPVEMVGLMKELVQNGIKEDVQVEYFIDLLKGVSKILSLPSQQEKITVVLTECSVEKNKKIDQHLQSMLKRHSELNEKLNLETLQIQIDTIKKYFVNKISEEKLQDIQTKTTKKEKLPLLPEIKSKPNL